MTLSRRSGVDKGYISRILSGQSVPGLVQAWKLANALGVGIEDLFVLNEEGGRMKK